MQPATSPSRLLPLPTVSHCHLPRPALLCHLCGCGLSWPLPDLLQPTWPCGRSPGTSWTRHLGSGEDTRLAFLLFIEQWSCSPSRDTTPVAGPPPNTLAVGVRVPYASLGPQTWVCDKSLVCPLASTSNPKLHKSPRPHIAPGPLLTGLGGQCEWAACACPWPAALGPFVSHDPTDTPRVPPEVAGRVTLHGGCSLPGPMEVDAEPPALYRQGGHWRVSQRGPGLTNPSEPTLSFGSVPPAPPLPHRLPRCPTVPERDGRPWLWATPSRGCGTWACSHHPSAWIMVRSDPSLWL